MNEKPCQHFFSVEPGTAGAHVRRGALVGDSATVVIPWDQAVEVSRCILLLARDRGDAR